MTLIIIPARMGSTRLPGKPLLKIGDKTIIERCAFQALKANFHPIIATDSEEIEAHCSSFTSVVMTGECASGTDRVAAAAEIIDPEGNHEFVINYQGDMPFLDPECLAAFVRCREDKKADILTAYVDDCCVTADLRNDKFTRESRKLHVGIYGFKRQALRKFATLPQSPSETTLRLEQCRLPEMFSWAFLDFPSMPIEINTQADLDRARSCLM